MGQITIWMSLGYCKSICSSARWLRADGI